MTMSCASAPTLIGIERVRNNVDRCMADNLAAIMGNESKNCIHCTHLIASPECTVHF